jgi:predicted transcriptional regulator
MEELRMARAERLELRRAVEEAERDIAEGNWVEHPEILAKLKRWSAGATDDRKQE